MQWAALMMLTEWIVCVDGRLLHQPLWVELWYKPHNNFQIVLTAKLFFIYRRSHAIARPRTTFIFMVLIFSRKVNPRKRNKLFAFVSFHHLHHDYCLFVFVVKCFDPPIHGGARYSIIQLYGRCSCVSERCLCEGNSRESMWTMFRGVSR